MLAQLSDPRIQDDDPRRRWRRPCGRCSTLTPLPDAVLVSGDLAEHGTAAEYERVRELLAPLPMPVHVLPGNHDDRDVMRANWAVRRPPTSAACA